MKKLLLVFLFLSCFAPAQNVWIQPGAIWHYSTWVPGMGGFVRVSYMHDTLINGTNCQKLESKRFKFVNAGPPSYQTVPYGTPDTWYNFTHSNGDTVFYLNGGSFYVLYNFGAQAGDTWDLGPFNSLWGCGNSMVKVDSTGTINFNGTNYRWISLSDANPDNSIGLQGKAVERFGSFENSLFPKERNCDSSSVVEFWIDNFRCFEDSQFPLVMTNGIWDCEYEYEMGIGEIAGEKIEIFPNPSEEMIRIKSSGEINVFRLCDLSGKLVTAENLNGEKEFQVTLEDLKAGAYLLELITADGKKLTRKLIRK